MRLTPIRYGVEAWVRPGVQVACRATDDRAEALRWRDELRAKYASERPEVVIYDNERGGLLVEDGE